MKRGVNHLLKERRAECASLHLESAAVRRNAEVQRYVSFSYFESYTLRRFLCSCLQVILWLKMGFVLPPNLISFALLLVHLPYTSVMNLGDFYQY